MTSNTNSSIYLIDDDQAVRESLTLYLESKGLTVVSYSSAQDFLESYDKNSPGCLLLDIRMPGMNGLDLQEYLTQKELAIPIIFITGHGDISMAAQAFKGGAIDFLEKPFENEGLLKSIGQALSKDTENRQKSIVRGKAIKHYEKLTPRERDVMTRVVAGYHNKDIAKELEISHRTVEIHRHRVMEKMEAKTLSHLISLAVLCGIHTFSLEQS